MVNFAVSGELQHAVALVEMHGRWVLVAPVGLSVQRIIGAYCRLRGHVPADVDCEVVEMLNALAIPAQCELGQAKAG